MDLELVVPVFSGVVATSVGFALNQAWVRHREKIGKFEKLIGLLQAGIHEVDFNQGKIETLYKDLHGDPQKVIIPSYNLAPQFLDTLKGAFIDFSQAAHLVPAMSHLHYELMHIKSKVDAIRDLMFQNNLSASQVILFKTSIASVTSLLTINKDICLDAKKQLEETLRSVDMEFLQFKRNSIFECFSRDVSFPEHF